VDSGVDAVNPEWVVVGRFCRPHGIKGFIRVLSFTEPRDNLFNFPTWYVQQNQQWQPIERVDDEITHKHILTRVKGYLEREDVAALTNCDIAVPRSQLPELDNGEHYWHELMGMRVIDQQGQLLGEVTELMMTGSNDVLIVEGDARYLIPYLPDEVIQRVDKQARTITVDWDVNF
jgi:16S rRNA processing protein RimM